MKKLYVFVIVTLLVLVGINVFNNISNNKELSNEVLISMYLEAAGGSDYDEIECCERAIDDSNGIDYITYLDGKVTNRGWVNENYCKYYINGEYN